MSSTEFALSLFFYETPISMDTRIKWMDKLPGEVNCDSAYVCYLYGL